MTKFIQIHALTGYSAALINRDDTGLAKRINFGGKIRTRISSQCQKRAWRMNEGADAIAHLIDEASDVRTKLAVETLADELIAEGISPNALRFASDAMILTVYDGKFLKKAKPGEEAEEESDEAEEEKPAKGKAKGKGKKNAPAVPSKPSNRQALLLSATELRFIRAHMQRIATADDPKAAADAFMADYKDIVAAMREQCEISHGIVSSLFGRMVASDPSSNIDAAIHVSHAFTVHADRSESDYFTAVDDLKKDDAAGAGHLGDVEINSGLFYGYVTVDVDLLVSNLGGDRGLASEVVRRLIRLIASVSPGAKRGSTAPYGYASSMLVEAGDAQPRSLAEAYRKPIHPETHEEAEKAMAERLKRHDATYATGEERIWLSMRKDPAFEGRSGNLAEVADFAAAKVIEA